jgi:hypothetical protein
MRLWEYSLTAPSLCLGERLKAGLFRPCDTRTIRYSAITGALRQLLPGEVHAAGYILQEPSPTACYWVYGPRDRGVGVSKLPITVQFLANVEGRVYLVANNTEPPRWLEFSLGALKSYGFGRCRMELLAQVEPPIVRGRLLTRLPEDVAPLFSVASIQPRYGYLFRPTSSTDGIYVRSLFEDSLVEGPSSLVKEDVHA